MRKRSLSTLPKLVISFVITTQTYGASDGTTNVPDIQCLKTLRSSISDPDGYLSSWDFFNNSTQGFICKFNGIDCWDENKNRILSIRLSNMGLIGRFPSGLEMCTSMMYLDLSGNNFSGPLPTNISEMLKYITLLDLSFNNFSGEIPTSFSQCIYLNTLNLQYNSFQGQIPGQLALLVRLASFNVASNFLSGPIPAFKAQVTSYNFSNNPGLCGKPLNDCSMSLNKKSLDTGEVVASTLGVIIGFSVGIVISSFVDLENPRIT
ncbi:hypothetical protein LUZ60_013405 [Juncus effusus]|nr:hypothetical protein LUZ60_013405 [Juncus effusus]